MVHRDCNYSLLDLLSGGFWLMEKVVGVFPLFYLCFGFFNAFGFSFKKKKKL